MISPAIDLSWASSRFDANTGVIEGAPRVERRLSDLRGCFADPLAYEAALARGNPVVYSVASVEPATGPGDLHYGLGVVQPGRVGEEYFLTRGHLHHWREAAEIYLGLSGDGLMLLECERTGGSRIVPLHAGHAVYVPGHTAHRTINTGDTPLAYIGVYPAAAGHDYDAKPGFRQVVVARDGRPVLLERASLHV
jgi:glucose-6-phosphate isomerase, archaeal